MTESIKKRVILVFIAFYLFLHVGISLPVPFTNHQNQWYPLWLTSHYLGQSHSSWNMFSPVPYRLHVRLEAEMYRARGDRVAWRSPDWPELNVFQKFISSRRMKFIDLIRLDTYKDLWKDVAAFFIRTYSQENNPVQVIELARLHYEIRWPAQVGYYMPIEKSPPLQRTPFYKNHGTLR